MSGALREPAADLSRFPARPRRPRTLFRISFHRGRDGKPSSPWRFSARPGDDNRFDLTAPKGTCYWSDRPYGAFVEVFRGLTLLDPIDLTRRRLFVASAPALRLADLTSTRSYAFGVTAEISTSADYTLPQRWAAALELTGVDGLWGTCRHDPSSRAHNVAVFGAAGTQTRRAGWSVTGWARSTSRWTSCPGSASFLARSRFRTTYRRLPPPSEGS